MHPGKKIHVLSHVERRHIVSAYKQAKLFVFGSKIECSPLVLFEAMAAKLPFVTTACGNSAELASMSKNYVVSEPKQMADKIDYLLKNTQKYKFISNQEFKIW